MIMRAKQDGDFLLLDLEGQLDFETTLQFGDTCEDLIDKSADTKVIFNLSKLKFVGSSGINHFIKVLKDFNSMAKKPRYCLLSSEFTRVFRAYQTNRNPFHILETEELARASFDIVALPPTPKKRTTKKSGRA